MGITRKTGEFEQALARVAFSVVISLYLVARLAAGTPYLLPWHLLLVAIPGFFLASLGTLLAAWKKPAGSIPLRWAGLVLDLGTLTYVMAVADKSGVVLFGIYLWVVVGNGARYGRRFLLAAQGLSLAGFGVVVGCNPFLQSEPELTVAIFATLVLIPLYLLRLLATLKHATATAEEASRVKSRFMAHVSHEMRTPLHGILGASDLLSVTTLNPQQNDLIRMMQSSSKTLLQLVENVLDFSRIERGQVRLETVEFNLQQVVRHTAELLRLKASAKGLELRVQIASDTAQTLRGDVRHLRQILLNLVGNAIKFTETGSVRLMVSVLSQGTGSTVIRFDVADTGIGIDPANRSRIFESFVPAHEEDHHLYGGLGLGNTIARELVEQMGGQIGFVSDPGTGTVFWFELPFELAAPPEMRLERVQALSVGLRAGERAALTESLQSWGIRIRHTQHLAEFLTVLPLFRQMPGGPKVIFCDPHTLGLRVSEFLEETGVRDGGDQPRLILVSAAVQPGGEAEVLALGYAAVLGCPLDKPQLFNVLHGTGNATGQADVIPFWERYRQLALNREEPILVVDDDGTSQKIVAQMLEYCGHRVDLAANGPAGLESLKRKKYSLLLLDLQMPGMSGLEMLALHRAAGGRNARVPVIILTANDTLEAMLACEAAGVDAYLTKPIDTLKLLDTVSELIPLSQLNPAVARRLAAGAGEHHAHEHLLVDFSMLESLVEFAGSNGDFIRTVIHGFFRETEDHLQAMADALARQDHGTLVTHAQTLKGSAANMGALVLSLICDDLNQLAPHQLTTAAGLFCQQAQIAFTATRQILERYLENQAGKSVQA